MQQDNQNHPGKKALSLEVKNQLTQSLGHLKELWGEKKFNNKIEEAVKLFTKGFKKAKQAKEAAPKEKKAAAIPEVKKAAAKKVKVQAPVVETASAMKKSIPEKAGKKPAAKSVR